MNLVQRIGLIFGAVVAAAGGVMAAETLTGGAYLYGVTSTKVLGGDGGWDYLTYDAPSKRLFISRATRVMVVDPAIGKVVAEVPGTPGVHGIVMGMTSAYTSNGRDNSVTVFDPKTFSTITKIAIGGKNPDAIVYDPFSHHIVTFNGGSNDATVIDSKTNTLAGTIPLPGRPEFAVTDGRGKIYDNIEDKNEIVVIDAAKETVVATWPLAPCDGPSGLALDAKNRRLFAVCSNKLMTVVDADSGNVITTLPIGEGSDAAGFNPKMRLAYSSNGDGTLTIVKEDGPNAFHVAQTLQTQKNARTLAVNPDSSDVYLVTAELKTGAPAPGTTRPVRTVLPNTFTLLTAAVSGAP